MTKVLGLDAIETCLNRIRLRPVRSPQFQDQSNRAGSATVLDSRERRARGMSTLHGSERLRTVTDTDQEAV